MSPLDRYLPLAQQSAARWSGALGIQIPVNLAMAVMRQENPRGDTTLAVREPNGNLSRGLMMVQDTTAIDLGLKDPRLLTTPAIGIDYGVRYLGHQLVRYRGNVASAVAAYNAGTARFTERETFTNQSYVDRVLGFLRELEQPVPAAAIGLGVLAIVGLFAWAQSRPQRRAA